MSVKEMETPQMPKKSIERVKTRYKRTILLGVANDTHNLCVGNERRKKTSIQNLHVKYSNSHKNLKEHKPEMSPFCFHLHERALFPVKTNISNIFRYFDQISLWTEALNRYHHRT